MGKIYNKTELYKALKAREIPRHQYYRALQKMEDNNLEEVEIKDNSFTCYALQNELNQKIFIGIVNEYGKGFDRMVCEHLRMLKANTHHNELLQSEYNELSASAKNISFYILESNINCQDCNDIKQYYIDYYKTYDSRFGYNAKEARVNKEIKTAFECIKQGKPKRKIKV